MAALYAENITSQQKVFATNNLEKIMSSENNYFLTTGGDINSLYSNKEYIRFYMDIPKQYNKLQSYYIGISLKEVQKRISKSLSPILYTNYEKLTMELTAERSVFYTIKENGYTLFFQHYLDDVNPDEDDEAILSIFKAKEKLPSYAGNLDQILSEVSKISKSYPRETELASANYALSC